MSGITNVLLGLVLCQAAPADDPLPSWDESPAKSAILRFVERVTDEKSPDYVAPAERVATFDNDGTLWSEQPVYFQLMFAIDRVRQLAPQHPEWKTEQPFQSVLRGDRHDQASSNPTPNARRGNIQNLRKIGDRVVTANGLRRL
jgi:hypothetical protein